MAETRRNEQQDPSGDPQGATPVHGAHADAHAGPSGNRPATGARAASAPPDTGWQAGAGATDFLGLEPELRTGGSEGGLAGGPTESWLFDIEQAESGAATTAVATAGEAQADAEGGYAAESEYAGEEGAEELEPQLEAATAAGEEFTDEPETESPVPARRGARRVLVSLAVLAALGTGGWYAWQRYGPRPAPHTAPEVATATPRATKPKPAPAQPTPAPATASGPATASPTEPSQPTAVAPAADPVELAAGDPPSAVVPADVEPATREPEVAVAPSEPAIAVAPAPTPAAAGDEAFLTRSANPAAKDPGLPEGNPGPGGGRHATARDWAGMWLEPTIPTDAIRGPTRLRTLNVGLVRAELVNGEFVEGRLHAVGESRIWLDVKLGRMSFDASDVRDLVQVVGAQGQPLPLGTQSLAGLARVEVLLPGGSLTGRVLGREGDRVTFLTEEGMRLRVEALDVRPAPNGRSRLVGPAATRKP